MAEIIFQKSSTIISSLFDFETNSDVVLETALISDGDGPEKTNSFFPKFFI